MKNIDIVKKEFKLHKFKELVNITAVSMFVLSPILTTLALTAHMIFTDTTLFIITNLGGVILNTGIMAGLFKILSAIGLNDSHFTSPYKFMINRSLSKFQKNNEDFIVSLRPGLEFDSLPTSEKDKIYKICAEVLVDNTLYSQTYATWMNSIKEVSGVTREEAETQFKRLNLLELVEHIRSLKGFDNDKLNSCMNELIQKDTIKTRPVFLYDLLEAKIEGLALPTNSQKTIAFIKEKNYILKDKDYADISLIVKKYQNRSFEDIQDFLKDTSINQVSWIKIKAIVDENHQSFSKDYLNLTRFLSEKILEEKSFLEQQKIVTLDPLSNPGDTGSLASNINNAFSGANESAEGDNGSTIFLNKCEILNYIPEYNRQLWQEIKSEYDLIYLNKDKLEPIELKKLNIGLNSILPLLMGSDRGLKNINASLDSPTHAILIQNLSMVKAEILKVKELIEQKIHTSALVDNTYLTMKARR